MMRIKSLSAILCAVALLAGSSFTGAQEKKDEKKPCCEATVEAGKKCKHECCVKAANAEKVCEKCHPKKDEKKDEK